MRDLVRLKQSISSTPSSSSARITVMYSSEVELVRENDEMGKSKPNLLMVCLCYTLYPVVECLSPNSTLSYQQE